MYNLYNTEAQFKAFLISGNISAVSTRNYLSDFRYFCGWYQMTFGCEPIENILNRGSHLLSRYDRYLADSSTPLKTIKRKLSTLRKYCAFLLSEGLIDSNNTTFDTKEALASRLDDSFKSINGKLISDFKYDLLIAEKTDQAEIVLKNVNDFITYITHD